MSLLLGKKIQHYDVSTHTDEPTKRREGKIISEPFPVNNQDGYWYTGIAILWSDGTITGSIDVEEIEILNDSLGYVVVAEDDRIDDKNGNKCGDYKGPLVLESYFNQTSYQEARMRIIRLNGSLGKCRIAQLNFIEE